MNRERVIQLSREILELDLKRDELYEELVMLSEGRGEEILRAVQNGIRLGEKKSDISSR
jgi:hypothetical protein